eukprot:TRINITY_DN3710_c0_g1_i7.p2 TRINITY_DN3710_c0_g1~~TRINITY_DN3710_c0_g1_i7.p2  ORF type:complete len:140 (-),score=22.35 TRINITY_DN3710_c0_g1_i7:94-513(-)
MIRRPPRSTHCISSAASDVYKRQDFFSVFSCFLQRLFGFVADVFQQLETHVHVALLVYAGQDAARQFGDGFLWRQAGNGIQQPPDCSSTFLVSTQLAERQQLAKQLQGGVHGFGIKFDPMYSALIPCLLYTSPSPRDQA